MRNNYKLKVLGRKFKRDGNIVRCKLCTTLLEPGVERDGIKIFGYGVATCGNDDKFNFSTGSTLALTRAEINAYSKAKRVMMKRMSAAAHEIDMLDNSIRHNKQFAKNLVD